MGATDERPAPWGGVLYSLVRRAALDQPSQGVGI